MKRLVGSVCLLASCAAFGVPLSAQVSTGGSVRGFVKDEQDAALQGARLSATSPDTPGTYTATSDDTGYYRLLDLPPGDYTIAVELDGFARWVREGVTVRAGLNVTVPVVLRVGTISETIAVKADTPLLESSFGGSAYNMSGDLQRAVPLSTRRDWAAFLALTPGVTATQSAQLQNYFFHGSSPSTHVMQVDGLDLMSAQSSNNIWINLSTEAIADVQIRTGAAEPATPLGLGAIANVVTRSSSDRLQGAVTASYQDKSWNGQNTPGGTSAANSLQQWDVALGGPIVARHWWVFGTYRFTDAAIGISRDARQTELLRTLVPTFTPFDNGNVAHFYFVKSNAAVGQHTHVTAIYQRDANPTEGNSATYAQPLVESTLGGPAGGLTLTSVVKSMTARVTAGYNKKGQENVALNADSPARWVHEGAFLSGGRLMGTGTVATLDNWGFNSTLFPYTKFTLSADLGYYRSDWLGTHEIKGGYYVQRTHEERVTRYPTSGLFLEESTLRSPTSPAAGLIPFHRRTVDSRETRTFLQETTDHALYFQDLWRPVPRLSLSAGLRVDFITRRDELFAITTQDSREIGPRFGANYLLTADGRTSLRGAWGRVHDALPSNSASIGAVSPMFVDSYDLDGNGTFETSFVTPGSNQLQPNRLFDSARHQPHVDELTIGVARQLPGTSTLSVGWIRRAFKELPAVVEVNGIYNNGRFTGYRDERANEIGLITNNRMNWPVYSAIEVVGSKDAEHLQLLLSYVRQWRRLAGTWLQNDPASFIQPNAFPNDRGIPTTTGDLSTVENSYSRAGGAQWRDHVVRLGVSYMAPWSFQLSSHYTFQSGLWSGPIVTRLSAADPAFGPPTLQLPATGRVVSNPLATPLRFAEATRSQGQFQGPNVHLWNIRVGRLWRLRRTRIEPTLDILNVTNEGAAQTFLGGANQTFSPNFRRGGTVQLPRAVQIGVRASF